ncbi:MAG: Organic solvent tolerance protein [Verrucomicrobia bacterium]|nr:Organic solvent tolerance protein [Verrucomicrobiota bacterium]
MHHAAFAARVTRRRILLLLVFLLVECLCVRAATAPQPDFTGDQQTYDANTNEIVGVGNAQLAYGDLLLTADSLRYNTATRVVVATGHATFTKGGRRLLADSLTYHLDDNTYTVEDLRMGEYPLYITGSSATGDKTTLTINDARAMVHEPGPFVPTLHATRIFYTPGQRLRAEGANLGVGEIRPVVFGLFQQNLREPLISYVSLTGGYRASLGVIAELGFHLPVTPHFRLGADLGVYTNRGLMFGPSGSYENHEDGADYKGFFKSGFIRDHGKRLFDVLGRPVPENRGFVTWEHQQQLTPDLTFKGSLNYWKDSEVLRDFRPDAFFPVQQPDTFLESVYTGQNYFVSLFARFQPNQYQVVQERLPELRFDLLPITIGPGITERFNASLAVLREDPVVGSAPALQSNRFDAYYSLSRTFAPTDWFTFTPVGGGRLTYYDKTTGGKSSYTRALGEVGFDAAVRASAVYEYKNEAWKIDGIRHLITPRLSYRYIPEADKGQAYIPQIDRESFSTYLPPLGLGDVRNIDELHSTNTLRLGLDNTLQTRDEVYGSRDLLVFNIATDLRFHRPPGQRDLSEVHTDFALMPARWMQFDVYESFAPSTFTLREFNTGLTIHDGDQWSARFSSNFLRHELDDYRLETQLRINEAYEAIGRIQYDIRKHRFNEQSYGIRHKISNLWLVEYVVTIYDGPRRESRVGFNIKVGVIGF